MKSKWTGRTIEILTMLQLEVLQRMVSEQSSDTKYGSYDTNRRRNFDRKRCSMGDVKASERANHVSSAIENCVDSGWRSVYNAVRDCSSLPAPNLDPILSNLPTEKKVPD